MTWRGARIFIACCAFRTINVLLIQSQFDPDEYWQQLEPAYCRVFRPESGQECPGLTWEWTRRPESTEFETMTELLDVGLKGPLRSHASIIPTLIFYYAIKHFRIDSSWMVARGPVFLNAILVAAPTDWCVWYLSRWMSTKGGDDSSSSYSIQKWCVYATLSSWFMGYAMVRTYSNSLETVLFALSLSLVGPELLGDTIPSRSDYKIPRSCLAFFLGGLSCCIRFTSLAAFVPMGIMLSQLRSIWSLGSSLNYLICICAAYGMAGVAICLALDYSFYEFLAAPFLGNIQFNVLEGNGRLYGTHPWHWYLTAGIPAISGTIVPFLIQSITSIRTWSKAERNLWIIIIIYAAAHSFSDHKEFRFLLPLLPLFCLLGGKYMHRLAGGSRVWQRLAVAAAVANLVALGYLGLVHQRAPIEVNRRIVELVMHEPQTYSIHYLMGCHATPILSHLHHPPIVFKPWTLDCNPSCRADSKVECESDRFSRDPGGFMEDTYFHCSDVEEGTCVSDMRIFYPDFLVAHAGDTPAMMSRVTTMGMKEVGRFVNGINGLKMSNLFVLGAEMFQQNSSSTLSFFDGQVELNLDEFVLFENRRIKPRY